MRPEWNAAKLMTDQLRREALLSYGPPLARPLLWGTVVMVVVGSVRGIIVVNTPAPATSVYWLTAVVLLLLAALGFGERKRFKSPQLTLLKNLLMLNLVLGIINVGVDLMLGVGFDPGSFYLYVAPYVVFLFLRIQPRRLIEAAIVSAVMISYSVATNFWLSLSGPAGLQAVFDYNARLRPDLFLALSRTGEFYRAAGYTGSYHDSANILGMAASFLAIRFLTQRQWLDLVLFLATTVCLTLTQSAANIAITIGTVVLFAGYFVFTRPRASTLLAFGAAVLGVIGLVAVFGDVMRIFISRLGPQGDWAGIKARLGWDWIVTSVPYLIAGHATAYGSKNIYTELSVLKILLQLGLIHTLILLWILIYPGYRFAKSKQSCPAALPSLAAVTFGVLSLLHYGSLFRVTSIFLFFALYSVCLTELATCGRPPYAPPMCA